MKIYFSIQIEKNIQFLLVQVIKNYIFQTIFINNYKKLTKTKNI